MVYVSLKSGVYSSDITSRAYIFISFEAIEMDDPSSADELTETDGAPMGQPNLASRSIADATSYLTKPRTTMRYNLIVLHDKL